MTVGGAAQFCGCPGPATTYQVVRGFDFARQKGCARSWRVPIQRERAAQCILVGLQVDLD
jgi:hypothetical protein